MNTTTMSIDETRRLSHADLLLLIADLLREPTEELPWHQLPQLLAIAVTDAPGLREAWEQLRAQAEATDPQVWSVEHHRLFEGAMACPANQTAYVRRDKGVVIGDLCGFYSAFHLAPTPQSGEKPDHLVTQLEFLSLLLVMTVGEVEAEARRIAADAARSFADDHMAPWLGMFSSHLRRTTALPLYHALAEVIDRTWVAFWPAYGWAALSFDEVDQSVGEVEPHAECGSLNDPLVPLQIRGESI
jgi:TorA maturation chaperone TorD